MHIARVVGWKKGETPSVTKGLKIEALATGLQHPRSLYTLPNGDVLVVESKAPKAAAIKRPKEIGMGFIESWATSGGYTGESNRITYCTTPMVTVYRISRASFSTTLVRPYGVSGMDIEQIDLRRPPKLILAGTKAPALRFKSITARSVASIGDENVRLRSRPAQMQEAVRCSSCVISNR
jgi:hypothetical protein